MRWVRGVVQLILIAACLMGLRILLSETHWSQAVEHIHNIPTIKLVFATLCVVLGYVCLTAQDWLAFRFIKQKVKFDILITTSLLANAVSNMVGFALLSGGAVRLRGYQRAGVPSRVVAKISLFCTATFLFSVALTAGLGLVLSAETLSSRIEIQPLYLQLIGSGILFFCLALPFFSTAFPVIKFRNRTFTLPSAGILWSQYIVGMLDVAATGLVLFLVLPENHDVPFFTFATIFSSALWLGAVSHVPGGIGFFEAVILAGLSPAIPSSDLLGSLIVYRILYYFIPFSIAGLVLLTREIRTHWRWATRIPLSFGPNVLALLIAFAGALLLFSGATPSASGRIDELMQFLPLGFIEGSHLIGSIVGLGLLLVARGIHQRMKVAWQITIALLFVGVVMSLVKGFDYEEALALGAIGVFTLLTRRYFYRPGRVRWFRLDWFWLMLVLVSVAASLWLMFFTFRDVSYQNELWWEIASEGDASRSLRSMLVVSISVIMLTLAHILRSRALIASPPSDEELNLATSIIATTERTQNFLALIGDKSFLFNASKTAFVMYATTGRHLVVMGDPVGPIESWRELIWRLREIADEYQLKLAFYQVSPKGLSIYLDAGLSLTKLGEEAIVSLPAIDLNSSKHRMLRQAVNKGQRLFWKFEIVPQEEVPSIEPQLAAISGLWLSRKKVREKSFSLGSYSTSYIKRFPIAVVRINGTIIAFTNLWLLQKKAEMGVDLMRFAPGCPRGVMDYLFVCLLVWGRDQGYQRFNLGMAPLSGLPSHRLAPLWSRLGAYIYSHGENFYNFQGVRMFKNKYMPEWRSIYLALSSGSTLMALTDVALLTSGGLRGMFRR